MDALPSLDPQRAARWGGRLTPRGPRVSRAEATETVRSLRAAAAASEALIRQVTRLDVPDGAGTLVLDRPGWIAANAQMLDTMLERASAFGQTSVSEQSPDATASPQTLKRRSERWVNSAEAGGALAVLATRVLGQYLPFGREPRLVLIAPNVVHVERELGVEPDDFRLWVCLHEQTHRFQFGAAPWLVDYLTRQLADLLEGGQGALWQHAPASLLDAVLTPAQKVTFGKITAVMSLLEGHADVMMDRVGPDSVPTVATIRAAFDQRRDRGGLHAVLNKALGFDVKLAQYRDGATFCRAVIERVGVEAFNDVFRSPGLLPTAAELHAPDDYLARVHPGA